MAVTAATDNLRRWHPVETKEDDEEDDEYTKKDSRLLPLPTLYVAVVFKRPRRGSDATTSDGRWNPLLILCCGSCVWVVSCMCILVWRGVRVR